MKRSEFSRTLRYMEGVREAAYEAENTTEERRLNAEYLRLWRSIEPYANGTLKLEEDTPAEAAGERAAWAAAR